MINIKKCCYTCEHYTPTYFGFYKGEVGDGKCCLDDICVSHDDCCEHYSQKPMYIHCPTDNIDEIPF